MKVGNSSKTDRKLLALFPQKTLWRSVKKGITEHRKSPHTINWLYNWGKSKEIDFMYAQTKHPTESFCVCIQNLFSD